MSSGAALPQDVSREMESICSSVGQLLVSSRRLRDEFGLDRSRDLSIGRVIHSWSSHRRFKSVKQKNDLRAL